MQVIIIKLSISVKILLLQITVDVIIDFLPMLVERLMIFIIHYSGDSNKSTSINNNYARVHLPNVPMCLDIPSMYNYISIVNVGLQVMLI